MIVERELLEHIDQRIKPSARAYVQEVLTASMDDLLTERGKEERKNETDGAIDEKRGG